MLVDQKIGRMGGPLEPTKPNRRTVVKAVVRWTCLILLVVSAMAGAKVVLNDNSRIVPDGVQTITYTVKPGDTVWSIASQEKRWQTGSVRDWIEEHNGYPSVLQPGEVIRIPER